MKILVTAAHPNELKQIKESIKKLNIIGVQISFLQTGIGNYETIFNLTKKLESESFDFILNIGICGYTEENRGIIQIARIYNLQTQKEQIVPITFEYYKLESIGCSEILQHNIESMKDEKYVDMESYGIEFVANKYNIPRLILKLPADKIGEKPDINILKKACENLALEIDYSALFDEIIKYLKNIPAREDLTYLKEKYRFTFQEFEIMKSKINKYEALSGNEFSKFFQKNNSLDKTEFLLKLVKSSNS